MNRFALKRYCICGDSLHANGSINALHGLTQAWDHIHSGEGHAPCNKVIAQNSRQRQADREKRKAHNAA